MKVVLCWISISGYLTACWRALARRPGVDLNLVLAPTVGTGNAPFARDLLDGLPVAATLEEGQLADAAAVAAAVVPHRPQVVVIPGWAYRGFNALLRHPELAGTKFILAMDTPRKDTWRQSLARVRLAPLLSRVDRVVVAGERAWQYARQLGVPEAHIRRGMYGFDGGPLAGVLERRLARAEGWPRQFLHVGRYVPDKGIDTLLAAYEAYRRQVERPWGLTTCGRGPFGDAIARAAGVTDRGFVQPADQPALFAEHGALVMASRYEPWGVAIAEGMAAGLPAICTEACGAAVELVRPYWNGLNVATGDPADLARALRWVHDHEAELPAMGQRAREAAAAFSADAWAVRWEAWLQELV